MAQHAVKNSKQNFQAVTLKAASNKKLKSAEAFSKASHFGWALLPMWVGVTYLFVKDMVQLSHVTVPPAPAASSRSVSLDASVLGQIMMLGLFYFGVGFGLWILRSIRRVEPDTSSNLYGLDESSLSGKE